MALKAGWNWWALVHSSGWFAWRRMYFYSALNVLAPWVALFAAAITADASRGVVSPDVVLYFGLALYLAAAFVVVPVFADALHAREAPKPPSAWTAFAAAGAVAASAITPLLMFLSGHHYPPRDKVSEA